MNNLKQNLARVRSLAATFDRAAAQRDLEELSVEDKTHLKHSEVPVWLVSLDNEAKQSRGGQVVGAFPLVAAELILNGTHEIATPAQIADSEAEMARRRVANEAAERERKGSAFSAEFMDLASAARTIASTVTAKRGRAK